MTSSNYPAFSRREMLKTASSRFGYLAFAGLAARAAEQSALLEVGEQRGDGLID